MKYDKEASEKVGIPVYRKLETENSEKNPETEDSQKTESESVSRRDED